MSSGSFDTVTRKSYKPLSFLIASKIGFTNLKNSCLTCSSFCSNNNLTATAEINFLALNKVESGYEILFKLYQPLPDNIQEKDTLWVVQEKSNPYSFDINLDKLVIQAPGPRLRGPNFNIDIPDQNNVATSYQTYTSLINSVQNVSTSSYQQFLHKKEHMLLFATNNPQLVQQF